MLSLSQERTRYGRLFVSQRNQPGSTKSTMMTVKAHASIAPGVPPTNLVISTEPQEYKPFLSCGYVYLPQCNVEKPIMILRDTVANQSLLLEATLPLSE